MTFGGVNLCSVVVVVVVVVAFPSLAMLLEQCSTIYSLPALSPFFLFFWWRLACAHKFHSLRQNRSTVAQQTDATVAKFSLTSYV